jgi:hypothetical protein
MFSLYADGFKGSAQPGESPVAGPHSSPGARLRPEAPCANPDAAPVHHHAPGYRAEQSRAAASGAPRKNTAT